jgi:hypothetical protein
MSLQRKINHRLADLGTHWLIPQARSLAEQLSTTEGRAELSRYEGSYNRGRSFRHWFRRYSAHLWLGVDGSLSLVIRPHTGRFSRRMMLKLQGLGFEVTPVEELPPVRAEVGESHDRITYQLHPSVSQLERFLVPRLARL